MRTALCCTLLVLVSAPWFVRAGGAKADPLAAFQGDWVCQGGGVQQGREGPILKLGLPFRNREMPTKITLNVKGDRWTMTFPDGTVKGRLTVGKGDKQRQEADLTIDGKDGVRLLGLTSPLTEGAWIISLNLPGKARPADMPGADFSYSWGRAPK